jgi:hypothetical protein
MRSPWHRCHLVRPPPPSGTAALPRAPHAPRGRPGVPGTALVRISPMSRIACIVAATLIATGCVQTRGAMLSNTVGLRPQTSPDSVRLYRAASQVPGKYQEIALLFSSGASRATDQIAMLENMRRKAAAFGANAVILDAITEPSAGAKVAGAVLGVATERQGRAVAIYVLPDSAPRAAPTPVLAHGTLQHFSYDLFGCAREGARDVRCTLRVTNLDPTGAASSDHELRRARLIPAEGTAVSAHDARYGTAVIPHYAFGLASRALILAPQAYADLTVRFTGVDPKIVSAALEIEETIGRQSGRMELAEVPITGGVQAIPVEPADAVRQSPATR